METFFERVRVSGLASRRIIGSMMTHDIWSHEGNSMYSYAQNQQDRWATDWQKPELLPAKTPAHTTSYTQLVAENKVISITRRGYDKNLQKWIVTHLCYLNYECETNTKWYIIYCTSINGGPTDLHLNRFSLQGLWILLRKRGIASGKFVYKMHFTNSIHLHCVGGYRNLQISQDFRWDLGELIL